jgi:hypothetical protein
MKKFALLVLAAVALPLHFASAQQNNIVINEVYAGGGDTGAPFNQDFVELFNNGLTDEPAVDIGAFTLQYKPATGSGTFTTLATIPSGTFLGSGQRYVIAIGPVGGSGLAVPSNITGSTGTGLDTTSGAVQLLNVSDAITDLVGWGSTANNVWEGGRTCSVDDYHPVDPALSRRASTTTTTTLILCSGRRTRCRFRSHRRTR